MISTVSDLTVYFYILNEIFEALDTELVQSGNLRTSEKNVTTKTVGPAAERPETKTQRPETRDKPSSKQHPSSS